MRHDGAPGRTLQDDSMIDFSRIGFRMPGGLPHKEYAVSDGTVSVILDGMEKRGLVQLERASQHGRSVRISITEKGLALYDQHMKNRKNIPQILGVLSGEERNQLGALLKKLDQKSRDILSKPSFL